MIQLFPYKSYTNDAAEIDLLLLMRCCCCSGSFCMQRFCWVQVFRNIGHLHLISFHLDSTNMCYYYYYLLSCYQDSGPAFCWIREKPIFRQGREPESFPSLATPISAKSPARS
jgi:hypothetical protein